LKVRFITRKWPPAVGGMETYCLRMSQEIAKRCSVQTIVLPGRNDGRGPSAMSILGFGIANALQAPFRSRADVVHLGDMAIWPLGFLELLFGRTTTLIISAHGSDISFAKRAGWRSALYKIYLGLGARLLRKAVIVANSSYIANLASLIGFEDVSIIPLGTDVVASGQPARHGLLFAGRVSRTKGLRFVVTDVLPLLPKSTLLRVAGPIWEESERELLKHAQVEYLGVLSPDQLSAQYSRAAITVIPSQIEEGFGLVAIEAAACGSQVIASNGGGLREAVRLPWGDLVDPNDPQAWAAAITRRLSLEPNVRKAVCQAAREDIDQHFRWHIVAEQTIALYRGDPRA
jgi:phosphatidyl-myo-inositol dimannoside synthase